MLKYRILHSRCRASDTFSRLWKYMARWYYWRATAQTLRTDVSRAKFGGEGGILNSGSDFRPARPWESAAPRRSPPAAATTPGVPLGISLPIQFLYISTAFIFF